ncbi:hypothetical protein FXO38_16403 [Capsicum annuum]|nr:hypothetical protein FXO38_16403 [Capsicum annuum]
MMKPSTKTPTIIVEIFSWLPVTSLMQFRCVSRFLNSLVSKSDFVDIHQCRSMTREGAIKLLVRKSEGFYILEQSENGRASRGNFDNLHYDHVMYVNGLFCVWNQDVKFIIHISWRKLKTNEHPYEGYIKDVYSYKENLFPLGRIWSPCGDDFASSEEELLYGDDFVSSEEELPCGVDFVPLKEELLSGDDFVSSEEELPCGGDFVSSEEELSCGYDFVSSEEELSCGDDFVTSEEELYYIHL